MSSQADPIYIDRDFSKAALAIFDACRHIAFQYRALAVFTHTKGNLKQTTAQQP
ncbi:MAG: hypothetical protein AAGN15_06540 [Cyanobacteria bacterium J06581_3]